MSKQKELPPTQWENPTLDENYLGLSAEEKARISALSLFISKNNPDYTLGVAGYSFPVSIELFEEVSQKIKDHEILELLAKRVIINSDSATKLVELIKTIDNLKIINILLPKLVGYIKQESLLEILRNCDSNLAKIYCVLKTCTVEKDLLTEEYYKILIVQERIDRERIVISLDQEQPATAEILDNDPVFGPVIIIDSRKVYLRELTDMALLLKFEELARDDAIDPLEIEPVRQRLIGHNIQATDILTSAEQPAIEEQKPLARKQKKQQAASVEVQPDSLKVLDGEMYLESKRSLYNINLAISDAKLEQEKLAARKEIIDNNAAFLSRNLTDLIKLPDAAGFGLLYHAILHDRVDMRNKLIIAGARLNNYELSQLSGKQFASYRKLMKNIEQDKTLDKIAKMIKYAQSENNVKITTDTLLGEQTLFVTNIEDVRLLGARLIKYDIKEKKFQIYVNGSELVMCEISLENLHQCNHPDIKPENIEKLFSAVARCGLIDSELLERAEKEVVRPTEYSHTMQYLTKAMGVSSTAFREVQSKGKVVASFMTHVARELKDSAVQAAKDASHFIRRQTGL